MYGVTYSEEEFLQLSGLQHFAFCRRQWALIHVEDQWAENLRTVEGDLFHRRAHDEKQRERRGDTLVLRDLPVYSPSLGVSGKCDVVEFHADPQGVPLRGEDGLWSPYPVEYKRGAPKSHSADGRGHTPRVKHSKACSACSLKELCLPALLRERTAGAYLRRAMEEEP